MPAQLMIFTDLDGCLLNKSDYDWSAAKPILQQLKRLRIPVVLNSSKTAAEMRQLATEFQLSHLPFISENGGVIQWNDLVPDKQPALQVLGVQRSVILELLSQQKQKFRFRSFFDLGVAGIMQATDLDANKAALANDRQSTEPLLWDDTEAALHDFRNVVEDAGLTLTRGGRFWHVTGQNAKGTAMQVVADRFAKEYAPNNIITAGIGDSPIDQTMLDVADYPIGIPAAGALNVRIDPQQGIVASEEGSAGWADAVTILLKQCGITKEG